MKYLFLLTAFLLVGCQKPSIYLYSKYITETERQKLTEQFEQEGYQVVVNTLPFPQGVRQTSILYSPMLKDPNNLDKTIAILKKQGIEIDSVSSLVEGSHFVTKDALAVFIVFNPEVFAAPVKQGQIFASQNCDNEFELHINQGNNASVKINDETTTVTWRLLANNDILSFRKYQGADYNYDVIRDVASTPVGVVDEIRLKPIVSNSWLGECEFYYGLVRTAN